MFNHNYEGSKSKFYKLIGSRDNIFCIQINNITTFQKNISLMFDAIFVITVDTFIAIKLQII